MKTLLVGVALGVTGDRRQRSRWPGGNEQDPHRRRAPAHSRWSGGGALRALVIVADPLPDMTAAKFCRRTRARPEGADAVILVITSRVEELPAVLDAGATDLYATSLGPAALETRVLISRQLVTQHARLRDRELRFRRLFESGVAGVIISDLDGNFQEANDAFLRMLGCTREENGGRKLNWEVISPPTISCRTSKPAPSSVRPASCPCARGTTSTRTEGTSRRWWERLRSEGTQGDASVT